MRTSNCRRTTGAVCALLLALVGLTGCQDEVEAPPLMGPSGLALSIEMAAEPAILNADGASTSTISILARDAYGKPLAGKALFVQHDGDGMLLLSAGAIGGLQTGGSIATDGSGVARFVYRAGTEPNRLVTISCEPYSTNVGSTGELPRYVVIHQR